MTTNKWKKIIDSCQEVSNVTLVCCDGVLHSHKIMIAVVSDFMNDLIKPIPAADNVTFYLPDFQTEDVLSVLDQFNFRDIHIPSVLDEDLLSALNCSSNEMLDEVFREESVMERSQDEIYDHNNAVSESKPVFIKTTPIPSGDFDLYNNPPLDIKSDPDCDEKFIIDGEDDKFEEKPLISKKIKNAKASGSPRKIFGKKIDWQENQQQLQEKAKKYLLNDDADYSYDDDNSLRGEKRKIIIEKRQKHRSAIEAISRGECCTIAEAAKKYEVSRQTLSKFLSKGKNFQGRGKVSRVFSYEEEKVMAEKILAKSDGGKNLNFEIISEVVNEELSIKRINHPEKNLSESFSRSYKYAFARRTNLDKLIQDKVEAALKDRRIFECEICYQKFTFKNSLVCHQKKSHLAFYNC